MRQHASKPKGKYFKKVQARGSQRRVPMAETITTRIKVERDNRGTVMCPRCRREFEAPPGDVMCPNLVACGASLEVQEAPSYTRQRYREW